MPACFHLDIVKNSCGMVEAVKFMLSALSRLADKVCCIALLYSNALQVDSFFLQEAVKDMV